MKSILLATGMEQLDTALVNFFKRDNTIRCATQKVYFREGLGDAIIRNEPDVVILSEYLEGNTLSMEQLIRITRKKYKEKQIIFILKSEESLNLKNLLFRLGVYDVYSIEPQLNANELMQSIFNPKEWKDVANQMPDLLEKDNFEVGDISLEQELNYSSFVTDIPTNNENVLHNSTAFWSPRQQSGSTTLAVNSAVLLSQVNGPCLIVDFNVNNPNVNFQLSVNDEDGNHNLNALCEDIEDGSFNDARMIEYYLVKHPIYTELYILPGTILKQPRPNDKTLIKALEAILKFGSAAGYSSVIIDVESGLNFEYQLALLKAIDKVVVPVLESPGTIISAQKMFDTEFGPFFLNLLDMKKLKFVVNKSTNTDEGDKIKRVLQSFLNKKVEVVLPYLPAVQNSTLLGAPFVREKPIQTELKPYLEVTNLIHEVFKLNEDNKHENKIFGIFKKTKG